MVLEDARVGSEHHAGEVSLRKDGEHMTALLMDLGNTRWKMALAEGAALGPVGERCL